MRRTDPKSLSDEMAKKNPGLHFMPWAQQIQKNNGASFVIDTLLAITAVWSINISAFAMIRSPATGKHPPWMLFHYLKPWKTCRSFGHGNPHSNVEIQKHLKRRVIGSPSCVSLAMAPRMAGTLMANWSIFYRQGATYLRSLLKTWHYSHIF